MPDLDKRQAAKERSRRRREERRNQPPRSCEDCGAEVKRSDAAHDPVRCGPCLTAYNLTLRGRAGYRPSGHAA